ncbi:lysis system i-spanin subunit Rz [Paraburkholderia sp. UCT2]|uniref:lysis system i-spanin subunit Rz n=1 Tax=Paraburkholderia sp. UCT2 TaxID=2615208 RepID=UPI00165631BB|nr:lysis system i-spanin subunit Rz [Paraburkholderia sp. UCT2]MBC8729967.1 lysozyme [Paraburkholderia sp. UCT2]
MNWKALIAGFALGCCVAGIAQQWRLGAQIASAGTDLANARQQHETELRAISDMAASAADAALAETVRAASAVAVVEQTYRTEQTNAQKTIDTLRADVRAGDVRLRVATASCAASAGGSGVPGAGAAAGGTDGTGTAELDGSAADALLGITGDGDRAIRKLTALQDYAREALRVCGVR